MDKQDCLGYNENCCECKDCTECHWHDETDEEERENE